MKLRLFIIAFLLIILISASRLKKKKTRQEVEKKEWATNDADHQNCWARCTELNGFACGFGDQGRWTSEFYQCNKNQDTCKNWLDAFEACRSSGCPDWRNSNLNNVLSVVC